MAKQTKVKTSESTATPSTPIVQVAPVNVPVVQTATTTATPAPVTEKKEKKVKAPKQQVAAPVVEVATPVVAPVVESAVQLVVDESAELDNSLLEKSGEFVAKLQQLGTMINSLKSEYKALEKQWSRDLKVANKQSAKKKKRQGSRAPSGFVKPTRISDELAQFLEQPLGSEMARTEVTKNINQYIRTNNLQDKSNGRKIIPDAKLSVLLKIKKGEELTYFNLQRYMSCHFAKSKAVATAAAATTTTTTSA